MNESKKEIRPSNPDLETIDLSCFAQEDRPLALRYIKSGTRAATHTTVNYGTGWRLPSPKPGIFDAVARGLAAGLKTN